MSATYNPYTGQVTVGNHESSDNIVGTYIGDMGTDDYQPIKVQLNGSNTPIWIRCNTSSTAGHNHSFKAQYVPETSYGTTTSPNLTFKLAKDTGAVAMAQGPARTATYTTTSDTPGITWFVDDTIRDNVAYVWDPTMHVNYLTRNHETTIVDQKKIEKAHKKSLKLLKDWLSDVEYNSLMEEGNLELPSQYEKDTIYIVNKDPTMRIGIKKKGKVVQKSLCIHASHAYADGDVLLANILLLKTDEKKFLEIANVHDFYA